MDESKVREADTNRQLFESFERKQRIDEHFTERLVAIAPELGSIDTTFWRSVQLIPWQCWSERLGNAQAAITPVCLKETDGFFSILNLEFRLVNGNVLRLLPYSTLFRNAIHEAAHVVRWIEKIRDTGNRFKKEMIEGDADHGSDFKRMDSLLTLRAKELGLWKPRMAAPDNVKNLLGQMRGRLSMSPEIP